LHLKDRTYAKFLFLDMLLKAEDSACLSLQLSGQTNEAFWNSVKHAKPFAIGLNCALGAKDMKKYIANLAQCADCFVFCYPNAGLPNAMGGYDQKGPEMAAELKPFCEEGLVNALGGCCGTSPDHIAAIRAMASSFPPRQRHPVEPLLRLSGLEAKTYKPDEKNRRATFWNIGERCNVAGEYTTLSLLRSLSAPSLHVF
jgi:5-methyltetrahydrofolate--homocysteine methyltransferase